MTRRVVMHIEGNMDDDPQDAMDVWRLVIEAAIEAGVLVIAERTWSKSVLLTPDEIAMGA